MQNLIGKYWEQSGRAAQQNGEKIQRNRGQNDLLAQNESHPRDQAVPCILPFTIPRPGCTGNRQHQSEKEKRTEGIDDVNTGETDMRHDKSADGGTGNRTELKSAVCASNPLSESRPR